MKQKELLKLINESISKHIDNMCLNESIQKAINEELGISNEIVQTAQRIKDIIINNYRDLKPNRIINGIKYYSNTIQVEAFETPLVIIYTIINLPDNKTYEENKHIFYGEIEPEKKYLKVRFGLINNRPCSDIDSILQHELTHLYQYIKRDNGTLLSNKYSVLYDKVQEVLNNTQGYQYSKNTDDMLKNYLAYALYISFNCEQDAYFHSFEAEIKDNALHWPSVIEETDLYTKLKFLRYIIKNYNELKQYVKPTFGITENIYIKIITKAEKRILKGIGRVLKLSLDEKKKYLGKTLFTEPYFIKTPPQPWKTDKH